jgi:hypothetical protein
MANGLDSTAVPLTIDPFYELGTEIEATKTKISESVFEAYKLSVAQTNDLNNRSMQVALANVASLANAKSAIAKKTLLAMLSEAQSVALAGRTAMETQRQVMIQGERDRNLANDVNTQNLNTALVNTNTAVLGVGIGIGSLGLACDGLNTAVQVSNSNFGVSALGSAISGQGIVNAGTGVMTGTAQTSTPTVIG